MKRKLFSVVLAAAMVLSLSACEKKTISDATGSLTSTSTEASVEASVETSTEARVEASVEASVEEAAPEEGDGFDIGSVDSDVYQNEFFNIKVTAPEDLTFLDSATIAALGQATADDFANSDSKMAHLTADAISSGATITDFYLSDENMLTTVNFNISSGKGLKVSDMDALLDATIPVLEETFSANPNLSNVKCVRSTTTFLGEEVSCLMTTADVAVSETESVQMFVKQVEMIKDGYVGCITCSTYFDDDTDDLLALVTPLN